MRLLLAVFDLAVPDGLGERRYVCTYIHGFENENEREKMF